MTVFTIDHFDGLEFVEKSKALGVDERVATYQARQLEHVIEIAVTRAKNDIENKELATKKHTMELNLKIEQVRCEIHKSKNELIILGVG